MNKLLDYLFINELILHGIIPFKSIGLLVFKNNDEQFKFHVKHISNVAEKSTRSLQFYDRYNHKR
jgi:hypothetical protein